MSREFDKFLREQYERQHGKQLAEITRADREEMENARRLSNGKLPEDFARDELLDKVSKEIDKILFTGNGKNEAILEDAARNCLYAEDVGHFARDLARLILNVRDEAKKIRSNAENRLKQRRKRK